ncbi:MAG: RDD family protein [Elusimicrobiota bacterium]|jgi:uncharacterized RDD family membrane protein YckC|nr:RDD family protein [Elusimicrobiota bacterium]
MSETKNPSVPENTQASVFERAIAFLLDVSLFISLCFWLFYILVKFAGWQPEDAHIQAWFAGFGVLFILYCALLGCGGRRTLGKALIGIAVVNKDTLQPLGFVKSFLRALGYIVGLITAFGGFALALLNKRRRAVHDFLGGSIVVSTREKSAAESAVVAAMGTALMGMCAFFVYYAFFIAPSAYQKMLVANADKELERIAQVQIYHRVVYGSYTPDIVRLGLISGDPVQFQREIQRNLKRRGFSMGVGRDGFTLKAVAKDKKETEVSLTYTD